ncbi:MAG TPA: hypothetical protein VH352_14015 [Pseudonocardiaceae bacterium]|nr:hypothetical protein [Pseudonocardiaceae bacterium]
MLLEVGAIVVAVSLGVAALLYVVQHFVPHSRRREHNDVAGFVYAVLGVLFAVMLGFVVVIEWESLEATKGTTFDEANELGALFWNARALPPSVGGALERTTKDYATEVIDAEWPLMGNGESSSLATGLVYTMRDEINALPTETPREQTVYQQSLDHVNNLAAARRKRIDESAERVPGVLWVVLILGAVLTVGYSFLFGLANFWSHLLISAPLGVMVVLALIVIDQLNHPFSGMVAVSPEAFHIFLNRLPPQR